MKYSVKTLRDAGLEAKWGKTSRGAPIMFARNPKSQLLHQRTKWWMVDNVVWKAMEKDGVQEGFDCSTLLGDIFSVLV